MSEALANYWNREWVGKTEDEVLAGLHRCGRRGVLVALDLETTIATPPCTNEYVHAMWKRHPKRIIQAWGAVEPAKGEIAIQQVRKAVRELGLIGFHFHPIMQHFAVDDRRYYPLFEEIASLGAAVMIDVGTTGMGAGMPGRHGRGDPPRPSVGDRRSSPPTSRTSGSSWRTPAGRGSTRPPRWRCTRATCSGRCRAGRRSTSPAISRWTCARRLQDKIMFGSDYPSMPYERILREWSELGYKDEIMEKIFHKNAERILGL